MMRALAALLPVLLLSAPLAEAQTPPAASTSPGATLLSISAQGSVVGQPDMAIVSLGVTTQGDTAAAALAENARLMNGLVAALRRAGVAERDLQTSNISVSPQYAHRENEAPRLTGYFANNTMTARVRRLAALGAILDSAVQAGGNTLNGVSFTYQDPEAQMDAARRDAIQDARRRAELYAAAAGLRVARIISITEGGAYSPPMPAPMMARMDAMAAPTPTAPGEIETQAGVSVVFELR